MQGNIFAGTWSGLFLQLWDGISRNPQCQIES